MFRLLCVSVQYRRMLPAAQWRAILICAANLIPVLKCIWYYDSALQAGIPNGTSRFYVHFVQCIKLYQLGDEGQRGQKMRLQDIETTKAHVSFFGYAMCWFSLASVPWEVLMGSASWWNWPRSIYTVATREHGYLLASISYAAVSVYIISASLSAVILFLSGM